MEMENMDEDRLVAVPRKRLALTTSTQQITSSNFSPAENTAIINSGTARFADSLLTLRIYMTRNQLYGLYLCPVEAVNN